MANEPYKAAETATAVEDPIDFADLDSLPEEEGASSDEPRYFIGLRVSALIETLIFLSGVVAFSHIFGDGTRYTNVSPHPFWIIILLVAVQYGTKEALASTVLATAFLFVGNLPPQEIQTTYEYLLELTYRPFLWLTASVIIGELRVRQIRERLYLRARLNKAEKETEAITTAYTRMKALKESLETRLAGEMRSAVAIYEAAKALKSLDQQQILRAVEEVIVATMSPQKFSLYMLDESGFRVVSHYGWKEAEHFVANFPSDTPLYRQIVGEKRVVCILNEDDEKLLSGQGLLAGPLIDSSSGEIFGMLKIEEMNFTELGMRSVETFRILCEWIGMAYANAEKYRFAKEDSMVNYDQMLFSHNFYKRQSEFLISLAKRVGFDLSVITIKLSNAAELNEEQRNRAAKRLGDAVRIGLRKVDHIFNERRTEIDFAILLPGTSGEDAELVVEKIRSSLADQRVQDEVAPRYIFAVQVLHKLEDGWKQGKVRWVEEA